MHGAHQARGARRSTLPPIGLCVVRPGSYVHPRLMLGEAWQLLGVCWVLLRDLVGLFYWLVSILAYRSQASKMQGYQ